MKKIAEACEEYGTPLPKVESENGEVTVTCIPSEKYLNLLNSIKKSSTNRPSTDQVYRPSSTNIRFLQRTS